MAELSIRGLCVSIPYVEAGVEATRRLQAGDRQLYCGECRRWVWPEQCAHEGRMTDREFTALVRRLQREVAREYPSQEQRDLEERRRIAEDRLRELAGVVAGRVA